MALVGADAHIRLFPAPINCQGSEQAGLGGQSFRQPPRGLYQTNNRGARPMKLSGPARAGRRPSNLCRHKFRNLSYVSKPARTCRFCAPAIFSLGPSTAQPLAALPLTDAAYPLRVRPVRLRPKCRRTCGGWPTTRACGRSLFVKNKKRMGGGLPS